jgi:hypothetical protein
MVKGEGTEDREAAHHGEMVSECPYYVYYDIH